MTESLTRSLSDVGALAIALSGGIDSITLSVFARSIGVDVRAYHATSAAVPRDATTRCVEICRRFDIALEIFDAGEMRDARYLNNPSDRCYFCKSNLYDAIGARTQRTVASGTNLDDLADFRPGLKAAAERDVIHPLAIAGLSKEGVRAVARELGLGALSEMPAQPCLSSRVQTGIAIEPHTLKTIEAIENHARATWGAGITVRCRVLPDRAVLELDASALAAATSVERDSLGALAAGLLRDANLASTLEFAPYRMGSAFLRVL